MAAAACPSYSGKTRLRRLNRRKVFDVSCSVANLIMGPAILTLPYTLIGSGWMGIIDLALSTAIMLFTGMLLGAVLEEAEGKSADAPTFSFVAELTLGKSFDQIFEALCAGEMFLCCVFMLTFVGQSLSSTLHCETKTAICSAAVLSVTMNFFPKRYLPVCSLFGLLFTSFAIIAVVANGLALVPHGINHGQTFLGQQGLSGRFSTVAAVCMCAGDHVIFPAVYATAGDFRTYRLGLAGGFGIFFLVAVVLSTVTYATFGNSVKPVATNNLGLDAYGESYPGFPLWLSTACTLGLAARAVIILPVFMQPVIRLAQNVFAYACDSHTMLPAQVTLLSAAFSFSLAVFVSLTYADLMIEIETLLSCFFKSVNVFVIPCLGYCTVCADRLRGRRVVESAIYSIALGGAVWGILGTMTSLKSLSHHHA
eukprot:TRINITY_DN33831_c0_g1_i1.p1 TRINITY_DN33831_c0_g1~~TRINITY_DN33831_c0_g1_i1.p1  ORF type:complete len:435 (-),score=63.44 TRINITY_DN33831_c0_g1_i1:60-1331(-)